MKRITHKYAYGGTYPKTTCSFGRRPSPRLQPPRTLETNQLVSHKYKGQPLDGTKPNKETAVKACRSHAGASCALEGRLAGIHVAQTFNPKIP